MAEAWDWLTDIVLEDLEAEGGEFWHSKGSSSLVGQLLSGGEPGHEKMKKCD